MQTATGAKIVEFLESLPDDVWVDDSEVNFSDETGYILNLQREYELSKFGFVYFDFLDKLEFETAFSEWQTKQCGPKCLIIECNEEQYKKLVQTLTNPSIYDKLGFNISDDGDKLRVF